jgi:hypothetical protein
MTHLLVRTWSTHEYGGGLDLGVVALTGVLVDTIVRRHDALQRLLREDETLQTVSFLDHECQYAEADVDYLVATIGQRDAFEDRGWAIAPEGFALPVFKYQPIETARMELDATSVWWSCCPKDGDVDVITERVAVVAFKELYAGKSARIRARSSGSRGGVVGKAERSRRRSPQPL